MPLFTVYLNDKDEVVTPDKATKAIQTEYDESGKYKGESFFVVDRGAQNV